MNAQFFICSLLFVFFCGYCYIQIRALQGLKKLPHSRSNARQKISVIVAARNEEKNISHCLQSLLSQRYPADRFEIIIVNDRSTDKTAAIVEEYRAKSSSIKLITIENIGSDLPPKKNALAHGIRQSKFDILAFTDADCFVPPMWLSCISDGYDDKVGAIAGFSPMATGDGSFFQKWAGLFLQYIEIKNSIGAAAAIGLDKAYMCTGRNFSYRKKVFDDVGGFEDIKHSISGDDDLFLQLVQGKTSWEVHYMLSPESFVETIPPSSFRNFLNQRKRHFSAAKYYPTRMKMVFGILHTFNGLCLISFFVSPLIALIFLALKLALDGIVLYRGTEYFGNKRLVGRMPFLELISMVYNIIVGSLGIIGQFEWKGSTS
jgi:cellulose synthase/poly-beta-1,6-N-acetylglucosamine synthase-like glycosyltransferase